jgi:hypothetical protein
MPLRRTPTTEESVNELVAQLLTLSRQTHAGMVVSASAKIESVLEQLLTVYMRIPLQGRQVHEMFWP